MSLSIAAWPPVGRELPLGTKENKGDPGTARIPFLYCDVA